MNAIFVWLSVVARLTSNDCFYSLTSDVIIVAAAVVVHEFWVVIGVVVAIGVDSEVFVWCDAISQRTCREKKGCR